MPVASAQTTTPPAPRSVPNAEWPAGHAPAVHDIVVPVVLVVAADGAIVGVELEASLDPALDAAAITTAARWTFEPARDPQGKPVRAKIRGIVRFKGVPPAPPAAPVEPQAQPATTASTPVKPLEVRVVGEAPPRSASESVQKRDVIEAAPHRTASDLLAVVPGLFVTQHSGQGKAHQIFLRGFDAVHGQDVEIWVAGAPVNEVSNVHGQGYADLHFAMPEVVKQLRSQPGTYDPRQGDFAVAGSLSYDLGFAEPGLTLSGTLGSYGERRLFLAYHPEGAPDTTFAAFETESTDGFGPSRAARRTSAIAQVSYELGSTATLRAMISTYAARFDSAGVLRLRDIDRGSVDRFATYDPKQGGDSSRTQIVLALGHEDDRERSSWSLSPYFILRSLRLRSDFTGYLVDNVNGDSEQQVNQAITVGGTGYYRRRLKVFSDDDALEGGFSVRNDWVQQSQRRLSIVDDHTTKTLVDAAIRATDVAGYLDASVRPLRRLTVRGGLRVDGLSYGVQDQVDGASGAPR